jgi:hypothetical protein
MSLVVTKVCQGADLGPLWTRTFAVVKDQVLNFLTSNFKDIYEKLSTLGVSRQLLL